MNIISGAKLAFIRPASRFVLENDRVVTSKIKENHPKRGLAPGLEQNALRISGTLAKRKSYCLRPDEGGLSL